MALVEEYSQALNRFAIWLLVLTPIAKYGLMLQPLNLSWELWFFNQDKVETWLKNHAFWGKGLLTILGRSMITGMLVYIALVFPGFDKVMVSENSHKMRRLTLTDYSSLCWELCLASQFPLYFHLFVTCIYLKEKCL